MTALRRSIAAVALCAALVAAFAALILVKQRELLNLQEQAPAGAG